VKEVDRMDAHAERELTTAIGHLLKRVADAVAEDARRFAPVDTGHLRSTIHAEPVEGRAVRVVADADYAAYVELGTRHMAAEPFLRPALYRKRAI
jgi:HK97 gp10 family phage protein